MNFARALCLAMSAAAGLSACAVCERETAADGRYEIAQTDCPGTQPRGVIEIGPQAPAQRYRWGYDSTTCVTESAPDAGEVHGADSVADAGTTASEPPPSNGETTCVSQSTDIETDACPETAAIGAEVLGLPSRVRVLGEGEFSLHGPVGGRELDCVPEAFGDETLLFCRSSGRIACVAFLRTL